MKTKNILQGCAIAGTICISFNCTNVNAQALWQANGPSITYSFRSVGIKTDSPTNDFHVNGSFRTRSAFVDSVANIWRLLVAEALSVGGNLSVDGNSQFNGLVSIGSTLILNGANASISSTTGTVDFLNSGLTTTGNISADSIVASYIYTSKIHSTAIHSTSINSTTLQSDTGRFTWLNANALLQNGFPVVSSPWTISGSDIFYNSGKVGIGTSAPSVNLEVSHSGPVEIKAKSSGKWSGFSLQTGSSQTNYLWQEFNENKLRFWVNNADRMVIDDSGKVGIGVVNPSFPLHVVGDAAITGTVYADQLAAQSHISIGQFRFINGAAQPGQADTIRTSAALQIQAVETMQLTTAEALKMRAESTVEITSVSDTIKLAAGTVVVGPGGGPAPPPPISPVALDVVGDVRASGSINANSLDVSGAVFDSIHIQNKIKIGSSITIEGYPTGPNNKIYTDNVGDNRLFIQSEPSPSDFNTILNANNSGKVGIGTLSPSEKLTISTNSEEWGVFHTDGTVEVGTWIGTDPSLGSPSGWYGTKSNHPLTFFTNDMWASMIINTDGNVGIGTTSPGAKLEVAGQVKITGGAPGTGKVLSSDGAGLAGWSALTSLGGVSGSGTLNYLSKWTPDGTTVGNSQIFDNGTNVGIGTTNPQAKLDVNGTGLFSDNVGIGTTIPAKKLHIKTSHSVQGIRLEDEFNDGVSVTSSVWDIEPDGKTGKLYISDAIGVDTMMTFDVDQFLQSGKIGIGTTTPLHHLHLHAKYNVVSGHHDCCALEPPSPIPPEILNKPLVTMQMTNNLTGDGETDGMLIGVLERKGFINLQEDAELIFATDNGGITLETKDIDRLRIAPNGNVGIGTTSPRTQLEIKNPANGAGPLLLSTPSPDIYFETGPTHFNWRIAAQEDVDAALTIGSGQQDGNAIDDSYSSHFTIKQNGKVGIGTTNMPGNYRLYVKDGILAENVKSAVHGTGDWMDHKLQKDYKQMGIYELEDYIKNEGHVPGVPTAEEVVKNGVEMVPMFSALLGTSEDLILYTIQQQKEIDALKKEMNQLKKEIKKLKKEINK